MGKKPVTSKKKITYAKKWKCSRHGVICNTKAGSIAHETMSAGSCNITITYSRSR